MDRDVHRFSPRQDVVSKNPTDQANPDRVAGFNFFTLVGFFKAFFEMAAYSSNEIVDIIFVLDEAG